VEKTQQPFSLLKIIIKKKAIALVSLKQQPSNHEPLISLHSRPFERFLAAG
jgi:hypothetical protein